MWELIINKSSSELPTIKTDFSLKYKLASKDGALKEENVTYHHHFDIVNYEVRIIKHKFNFHFINI